MLGLISGQRGIAIMSDDYRKYREIIQARVKRQLRRSPFGRVGLTEEERINFIKNDLFLDECFIFLRYLENTGSIQKLNSYEDFAGNTISILLSISQLLQEEFDKKDWSELD